MQISAQVNSEDLQDELQNRYTVGWINKFTFITYNDEAKMHGIKFYIRFVGDKIVNILTLPLEFFGRKCFALLP